MGVSPTKGCASCQKKMHGRKVMHLLNSTTFDNVLMILMLIFWSWAAHGPLMGCSILALCLLYACSTLALCSLYALSMLSLCSRTWVGHEMGLIKPSLRHQIPLCSPFVAKWGSCRNNFTKKLLNFLFLYDIRLNFAIEKERKEFHKFCFISLF